MESRFRSGLQGALDESSAQSYFLNGGMVSIRLERVVATEAQDRSSHFPSIMGGGSSKQSGLFTISHVIAKVRCGKRVLGESHPASFSKSSNSFDFQWSMSGNPFNVNDAPLLSVDFYHPSSTFKSEKLVAQSSIPLSDIANSNGALFEVHVTDVDDSGARRVSGKLLFSGSFSRNDILSLRAGNSFSFLTSESDYSPLVFTVSFVLKEQYSSYRNQYVSLAQRHLTLNAVCFDMNGLYMYSSQCKKDNSMGFATVTRDCYQSGTFDGYDISSLASCAMFSVFVEQKNLFMDISKLSSQAAILFLVLVDTYEDSSALRLLDACASCELFAFSALSGICRFRFPVDLRNISVTYPKKSIILSRLVRNATEYFDFLPIGSPEPFGNLGLSIGTLRERLADIPSVSQSISRNLGPSSAWISSPQSICLEDTYPGNTGVVIKPDGLVLGIKWEVISPKSSPVHEVGIMCFDSNFNAVDVIFFGNKTSRDSSISYRGPVSTTTSPSFDSPCANVSPASRNESEETFSIRMSTLDPRIMYLGICVSNSNGYKMANFIKSISLHVYDVTVSTQMLRLVQVDVGLKEESFLAKNIVSPFDQCAVIVGVLWRKPNPSGGGYSTRMCALAEPCSGKMTNMNIETFQKVMRQLGGTGAGMGVNGVSNGMQTAPMTSPMTSPMAAPVLMTSNPSYAPVRLGVISAVGAPSTNYAPAIHSAAISQGPVSAVPFPAIASSNARPNGSGMGGVGVGLAAGAVGGVAIGAVAASSMMSPTATSSSSGNFPSLTIANDVGQVAGTIINSLKNDLEKVGLNAVYVQQIPWPSIHGNLQNDLARIGRDSVGSIEPVVKQATSNLLVNVKRSIDSMPGMAHSNVLPYNSINWPAIENYMKGSVAGLPSVASLASSNVWNAPSQATISSGIQQVSHGATVAYNQAAPVVGGAFNQGVQAVSGAYNQAAPVVGGAFNQGAQAVSGAYNQAAPVVGGAFNQGAQAMSGAYNQAAPVVGGALNYSMHGMSSISASAGHEVGAVVRQVDSTISSAFGSHHGGGNGIPSAPSSGEYHSGSSGGVAALRTIRAPDLPSISMDGITKPIGAAMGSTVSVMGSGVAGAADIVGSGVSSAAGVMGKGASAALHSTTTVLATAGGAVVGAVTSDASLKFLHSLSSMAVAVPLLGAVGIGMKMFFDAAREAKFNKIAAEALSTRIKEVGMALVDLLSTVQSSTPSLDTHLRHLKELLDQANEYMLKFSKRSYLSRLLSGSSDNLALKKLDKDLTDTVSGVQLCLGIQGISLQQRSLKELDDLKEFLSSKVVMSDDSGSSKGPSTPMIANLSAQDMEAIAKACQVSTEDLKDELHVWMSSIAALQSRIEQQLQNLTMMVGNAGDVEEMIHEASKSFWNEYFSSKEVSADEFCVGFEEAYNGGKRISDVQKKKLIAALDCYPNNGDISYIEWKRFFRGIFEQRLKDGEEVGDPKKINVMNFIDNYL